MSKYVLDEKQYNQYKELLSLATSLHTNLKLLIKVNTLPDMDFIKGIINHIEYIIND